MYKRSRLYQDAPYTFSTWPVCKWASPVKMRVHVCRTRAFVKLPLSRTVCAPATIEEALQMYMHVY